MFSQVQKEERDKAAKAKKAVSYEFD